MEYWIARDKDGTLWLFDMKPIKNENYFSCAVDSYGRWSEECELKEHMFPEVTFENSPQKIELKLIKE